MNAGVEIILQRMKDCPEDFIYSMTKGASKWSQLISVAYDKNILTQEEKDAITAGLTVVEREKFTEDVMKALAGEDETSDEGKGVSLNSMAHPRNSSGLAGLSSTVGAGSTQLLNTGAGVGGMSAVSGTISNGGNWGTSSVSTIGQQLQAYNAQLEAQYDAMKAQRDLAKAEKEKKHQTLFGKLFNYL